MNVTGQHEFHPGAESLNAFAEQALGRRERAEVLDHLAVCPRCRQVVALAQEAASAEVVAAAVARGAAKRPRAWWRSWGLALAPAAALAATATVLVVVHVRHVEQSTGMAKVESQKVTQSEMAAANPAQPQRAEAAPGAPATGTKASKSARSGAAPGEVSQEPVAETAMPAVGRLDGLESAPPEQAAPPAQNGGQGFAGAGIAGVAQRGGAGFSSQEPGATASNKKQEQTEAEAAERQLLAPKAKTTAGAPGADSGAPGSANTEAVIVPRQLLEEQSARGTSFVQREKLSSGAFSAADMVHPIHLPSGLPAVSTAAAGHLMLVIDRAGALFLSGDSGNTWEPVTKQWTGRAVEVRRQAPGSGNTEATPAAEAETAGSAPGSTSAAPPPVTVFEILNDRGLAWVSTDGKNWISQ
jgi:hypothetical protein